MDCPHCNQENLLGAKICVACNRNMLTAPPPVAAPPAPAPKPVSATSAAPGNPVAASPMDALCKVCLETFERPADDVSQTLCPGCRQFAPVPGGDAGTNDVQLHPATQDQPGVDPRAAGAVLRLKPVKRRASLRAGPVAAVAGLFIGLVTMGVVTFAGREKDPAASYLADAKREPAMLAVKPSKTDVVRLESTLSLNLVRELVRDNFANRTEAVLSLQQKTVQTADVAWVRDDPRGIVLDSAGECRLASQTGRVNGSDGRDAKAYPWDGHRETARLAIAPAGPTQMLGGSAAVAGRDIIPCLTLRDIDAPADVTPDKSWKTQVSLPLGMTRDGALRTIAFPSTVTYGGRVTRNGLTLHIFSLRSSAPQSPAELLDDMNRAEVTIRGALLYDAGTGLLAEAHITAEVSAWLDRGRIEDLVRVTGSLDVKRR